MTLQIVPLDEIPAFLADGWRVVARVFYWAVLMEKAS